MRPYITETLEQARLLLNLASREGAAAFSSAISGYVEAMITAHPGQPAEINRRLMALTSGFLGILFDGQTERIIRTQLQLTEAYIHEHDLQKKADSFISRIKAFIELQIEAAPEHPLCSRVVLHLRLLTLKELREVSVSSLAQAVGYNADHFTRKLKAESGQLPSDLIQKEKLGRAAQLIKSRPPGASLKVISFSLGFQDYPHFRELMKQHFGVAPSQL